MRTAWSKQEDDTLCSLMRRNRGHGRWARIASELGRSVSSAKGRADKLGVALDGGLAAGVSAPTATLLNYCPHCGGSLRALFEAAALIAGLPNG